MREVPGDEPERAERLPPALPVEAVRGAGAHAEVLGRHRRTGRDRLID